jgi:hypothetical protein
METIDALTETMRNLNAPLYRFLTEAFFLFCGVVLIPMLILGLVAVLAVAGASLAGGLSK